MHKEFVKQLKRQIKYLEASTEAYDYGEIEEAIRIATVLRTLFHDTKVSTSLFRHLKQKNTFCYISTFESIEERKNRFLTKHNLLIHDDNPPLMFVDGERKPPLGKWKIKKFLSFESWWNEKVLKIDDIEYSRRDIVLFSANEDGGTHVASKINNNAKLLKKGTGRIIFNSGETGKTELIDNHFLFLRQFAYEVLSIEKIFTVNNLEFHPPACETITYNGLLQEAEIFLSENKVNEAKSCLEKAIKYDSDREEAYNIIGGIYIQLKDYVNALRVYKKYLSLYGESALALANIGAIYIKLKDYDNANKIFEKAIKKKEVKNIETCFNILEYMLGFNLEINNNFMKKCEEYFKKNNEDTIYLDMFKILFIIRDKEDTDSILKEFKSQYIVQNIIYDFNDLLVLADKNNLNFLKRGIEFLLKP